MKAIRYFLLLFLVAISAQTAAARDRQSLAGTWRFALDPHDIGQNQRWFVRPLADHVHLPGTLQEQGFGNPPSIHSHWLVNDISLQTFLTDPQYAPYRNDNNFESPFWLTPTRHYVGAAWYQHEIKIPRDWKTKHIVLHLERPHWQTTLWLDDRLIGSNDSLGAPHDYELPASLGIGKHILTLRVDNRLNIPVGPHASSVTDMSQTDWNGVLGEISLVATDPLWLDNVQIYPDLQHSRIHVVATIGNRTQNPADIVLLAQVHHSPSQTISRHISPGASVAEFDYPLGPNAQAWDEFSPHLYQLHLRLSSTNTSDEQNISFGLREISCRGNQLLLNSRPLMLRGTLECCVFPLTGYPPMTVKAWQRIFSIARAYGLNHLRFHTWCPPEAAFEAADRMGFYLEVECSCWGRFGEGGALDKWLPIEGERMLRAFGNHPSFMFLAATNEPKGKMSADFLARVVRAWKAGDPRRLYSAGAGAKEVEAPPSDFHIEYATRFHQENGELSHRPQTADDYSAYVNQRPIPSIAHELGQWCAYPDFAEIPKYTGLLRPGNLEIFRDFLARSGMADQARDFLMASGHFQALLFKAEIEKVLRTAHMGGFELLGLHDFPGQGTSPVGVLDEFWDSKGYITAKEYSHFAGPTVPLARFPKLIFTADESVDIPVDICHFGPADLHDAVMTWRIEDGHGHPLLADSLPPRTIATGALTRLGVVHLAMGQLPAPARMTLRIGLKNSSIGNAWDFWVYPPHVDVNPPANVLVAHDLSEATLQKISAGVTALVLLPPAAVAGGAVDTFEPIFWNRVLFPKEISQTLGILCDPRHPALGVFPTDSYSNWQWWDLQQNSKPMILDCFPRDFHPVVQLIDDWLTCRKLGLIFEGRLGRGRLLVCSIDLQNHLENRPVARQLLHSLLLYAGSKRFAPKESLSILQLRSLVSH